MSDHERELLALELKLVAAEVQALDYRRKSMDWEECFRERTNQWESLQKDIENLREDLRKERSRARKYRDENTQLRKDLKDADGG